MSPIITSFRIWFITVLLNGLFYAVTCLMQGDFRGILVSMALCVAGFIIGLPFWLVMLALIEIVKRLPYSVTGKMYWLGGTMAICVAFFYACVAWLIFGSFTLNIAGIDQITGTTIAALIAALYLSRNTFRKTVTVTITANNQ
ncbi:MAG: hypothetical protein J7621_11930 [Niastella sp.]|nr:hypothetical protein [Niastella sp.]